MPVKYKFNYIITIHNKENLIKQVIDAVLDACGENSKIYPVLDGCTDNSEQIIDDIIQYAKRPIIKLYGPNVHEIKALNIGLCNSDQSGKGFNILLQDDVILKDIHFESKIIKIYETLNYSKIGVLALRHGVNVELNNKTKQIEEKDVIESYYGHGLQKTILFPGKVVERMVGVRSPECLSFEAVNNVGLMDENLAPYTYDNHDFSLRCIEKGYKNYVFSIAFASDVKWGGMRKTAHSEVDAVMNRNRSYLFNKHFNLIESLNSKNEYDLKFLTPFSIEGIENFKVKRNFNLRFKMHVFINRVKFFLKR